MRILLVAVLSFVAISPAPLTWAADEPAQPEEAELRGAIESLRQELAETQRLLAEARDLIEQLRDRVPRTEDYEEWKAEREALRKEELALRRENLMLEKSREARDRVARMVQQQQEAEKIDPEAPLLLAREHGRPQGADPAVRYGYGARVYSTAGNYFVPLNSIFVNRFSHFGGAFSGTYGSAFGPFSTGFYPPPPFGFSFGDRHGHRGLGTGSSFNINIQIED